MYFDCRVIIQRAANRYQLDNQFLENVDERTRCAEQDEFTIIHVSTKVQELVANNLAQRMVTVEKTLAYLSQETVKLQHESNQASNHLAKMQGKSWSQVKADGTVDFRASLESLDELVLDEAKEIELDLKWLERLQIRIKALYEKKEMILKEKLEIKRQYCELLLKQQKLKFRIECLQRRLDDRKERKSL